MFLPFVLVWLFYGIEDVRIRANLIKRYFMFFLLGLSIVVVPVMMRNLVVQGKLIFLSSSLGMNFYIGNNKDSIGIYKPASFEVNNPYLQQESYRREAERRTGRKYELNQMSRFWFMEGFKDIEDNPGRWLRLVKNKILIFLNGTEAAVNAPQYEYFKEKIPILRYTSLLNAGIVMPLGMSGILMAYMYKKVDRKALILLLYALSYLLVNIIFFITSEYRYPIVPIMIVFGAYCLVNLWDLLKTKYYVRAGLFLIMVSVLVVFSRTEVGALRQINNNPVDFANIAFVFGKTGKYDDAIYWSRKALEIAPCYSEPYIIIGKIDLERNQIESAIDNFGKSIECNPGFIKGYMWLGRALIIQKNYKKAKSVFEKLLEKDPGNSDALDALQCLGRVGTGKQQ